MILRPKSRYGGKVIAYTRLPPPLFATIAGPTGPVGDFQLPPLPPPWAGAIVGNLWGEEFVAAIDIVFHFFFSFQHVAPHRGGDGPCEGEH